MSWEKNDMKFKGRILLKKRVEELVDECLPRR